MGTQGSPQTPFGTDITLIEESLRLTPTERWERHARALAFVEDLREAAPAQRLHEDPRPAPR